MPASPESKTIWPAPAQASRRRSRNRALSAARPTRSVSRRRAASKRLSVTATPSTAKASTGSAKPFAVCRPRSRSRNRSPIRRRVAPARTICPGSARACRRAARLGVSPTTACSCAEPSPTRSPTTTSPVAMPMRTASRSVPRVSRLAHRRFYLQPGPHRPLGVVLMRPRIAEIGQHPVAHEFGDKAVIARDDAGNGVLIGADLLAQFLGVEPHRQGRRADEIAEHHRQLPPLGLARLPSPAPRGRVGGGGCRPRPNRRWL